MIFNFLNKSSVRKLLSLSDLVVFSITSLFLSIYISRVYGAEALAGFGTGLSIALVFQSVFRSIYVVPAAVMSERKALRLGRGLIAEHYIWTALIGALLLFVFFVVLAVSESFMARATTISAFYCTLLYMQADYDRFTIMRADKVYLAALLSTFNSLSIVISIILSKYIDISFHAFIIIMSLCLAARPIVICSLIGMPNIKWGWRFLHRNMRKRAMFSIASSFFYSGYNHVPVFILAIMAAPIETSAFIAMRSLVQPIQIFLRYFDFRDKLRLRSSSGGTFKGLRKQFWRVVIRNVIVISLVLPVLFVTVPYINHYAYGDVYSNYINITFGHIAIFSLISFMLPIESVINMIDNYRGQNYWRAGSSVVAVSSSAWLCQDYGAWGAIIACLAGWLIAVFGGVFILRKILFGMISGKYSDMELGRDNCRSKF